MDSSDVIESYVHDVARRLPLGRRSDVAFELRTLLTDDLRTRAGADGRAPDAAMAVAMLHDFGRPTEIAVRYYRPFTIIEPGDTPGFLVAALAGGGLVSLLAPPGAAWPGIVLLAWLGVLCILYGLKSVILRHRPDAFAWKPHRVSDGDTVNPAGAVALALLWCALLVLYVTPGHVVATLSGGRVAANVLAYSDSFTSPLRMPWLVGVLVAAIGLQVLALVRGRWGGGIRWIQIALTLLIGIQLGWHARYGSIFQDPRTDELLIPFIAGVSALIVIVSGVQVYREYSRVRPAPAIV
jgi:hypothetical protein